MTTATLKSRFGREIHLGFSPDEARDEHGRWTSVAYRAPQSAVDAMKTPVLRSRFARELFLGREGGPPQTGSKGDWGIFRDIGGQSYFFKLDSSGKATMPANEVARLHKTIKKHEQENEKHKSARDNAKVRGKAKEAQEHHEAAQEHHEAAEEGRAAPRTIAAPKTAAEHDERSVEHFSAAERALREGDAEGHAKHWAKGMEHMRKAKEGSAPTLNPKPVAKPAESPHPSDVVKRVGQSGQAVPKNTHLPTHAENEKTILATGKKNSYGESKLEFNGKTEADFAEDAEKIRGATGAPIPDKQILHDAVHKAVSEIGAKKPGELIPVHEVRQAVANKFGAEAANHTNLDEHLHSVWREGNARLVPISDLRDSNPDQRANALSGGADKTNFYFDPSSSNRGSIKLFRSRFARSLQS